jgi:hypothetical protein
MLRRSVTSLALILVGAYLAVCALLYFIQDRLIFFPRQATMAQLEMDARTLGFAPWETPNGERIGWQSQDGNPDDALLICHGNGGYALHRNYFASSAAASDDVLPPKIYLLEYPGYGARPGTPSETSLTAAAIDAIDLLSTPPPARLTVLGESLGSGVAAAAARARPDSIDALILVTPFDSLAHAAHVHYPWLPVPILIRHRFDSVRNLKDFPGPIAFIVAADDEIVPATLGQALYENYPGNKRLWLIPQANHNDTDRLLADWLPIWSWLKDPSN